MPEVPLILTPTPTPGIRLQKERLLPFQPLASQGPAVAPASGLLGWTLILQGSPDCRPPKSLDPNACRRSSQGS